MLESRALMSTFRVNTTLDTVAADLRTGKDATGHISLRSAIMAANASRSSDQIKLGKGTYMLTIAGANEDGGATGDLDITGNLTIRGSGSRSTIIDGNSLDRVLEVLGGATTISGVTIRNGQANLGAGLLNEGGRVTLSSVAVVGNHAVGADGATGAAAFANASGGQGGNGAVALGGGIDNAAGSLKILNSTITGNQARGRRRRGRARRAGPRRDRAGRSRLRRRKGR